MDPIAELIAEIDAFLERTGMSPTAFGRTILGDPSFVPDLKHAGRCPSIRTTQKVRQFMQASKEPAHG